MVAEGRAHDQPNSIQIDVVSRRAAVELGSAKYVERWPSQDPHRRRRRRQAPRLGRLVTRMSTSTADFTPPSG